MKQFKVKLISLQNIKLVSSPLWRHDFYLSYGVGVLASFLKQNHIDIKAQDLAIDIENANSARNAFSCSKLDFSILRKKEESVLDFLKYKNTDKEIGIFAQRVVSFVSGRECDLIGMSVMTYYQFLLALLLAKELKGRCRTHVVIGGVFVTAQSITFLKQFVFDYLIAGDGQDALLGLIKYLKGDINKNKVPNLIYRENGDVIVNKREYTAVEDICEPDFSDLKVHFHRYVTSNSKLMLPYQIGRGCMHKCSFCTIKLQHPFVEFKSYDKIFNEIMIMKRRYDTNSFFFWDETINNSYEYLDGLCNMFVKKGVNISWQVQARADNLDKRMLHKMKMAGCTHLLFGIESGSRRVLKNMRKGFTPEKASEILKHSHEEGINNAVFLMVGHPHENEQDIRDTTEFIRSNSAYIYRIYHIDVLGVCYGSSLYTCPDQYAIEALRPDLRNMNMPVLFGFDEINGLQWEDKIRQNKYFRKLLIRADYEYIFSKKYPFKIVPFWFYYHLWNKQNRLGISNRLSSFLKRHLTK